MAVVETHVDASPEQVFAVLGDCTRYGEWVVGTRETGPGDGEWPAPGSSLRYTTAGLVPLTERTVVIAAEPPRRLELYTRGGVLPDARIVLEVEPHGGGSRVRLEERPVHPLLDVLLGPVGHFALARRNALALARLRRVAEAAA